MATLEDKILGEKKHYYCDSSDSDREDEESEGSDKDKDVPNANTGDEPVLEPEINKWDGVSTNTGPKGVLKDWQRYKQLETEKRQENELERLQLAKKLCIDGTTQEPGDVETLLNENDDFLEEFRKKRMQEINQMIIKSQKKFGQVISLADGKEFLDAVDNEDKSVTVIVHIYEENTPACKTMNRCFESLAKQYSVVKFCKLSGSSAGLSHRFNVDGIPAILVYKEGQMVGNFIRVTNELGDVFYDGDVENFLIENGILLDRHCVPDTLQQQNEDDDSDWSLE